MQHLQPRQQGTFTWGLNNVRPPSVRVVTRVLTTTCRLQVTGLTLPACGTVELFLNTAQLPTQQAPAAPYSLIAYPVQGLPSIYPLTLTGTTAPWTVNFPAGEPPPCRRFSFRLQSHSSTLANNTVQEPSLSLTLLMRMETREEYRHRFTRCSQANPQRVFRRPALRPLP